MHHLGIALPITSVEQVQHVLFEFLAVLVDTFSSLLCTSVIAIQIDE